MGRIKGINTQPTEEETPPSPSLQAPDEGSECDRRLIGLPLSDVRSPTYSKFCKQGGITMCVAVTPGVTA